MHLPLWTHSIKHYFTVCLVILLSVLYANEQVILYSQGNVENPINMLISAVKLRTLLWRSKMIDHAFRAILKWLIRELFSYENAHNWLGKLFEREINE